MEFNSFSLISSVEFPLNWFSIIPVSCAIQRVYVIVVTLFCFVSSENEWSLILFLFKKTVNFERVYIVLNLKGNWNLFLMTNEGDGDAGQWTNGFFFFNFYFSNQIEFRLVVNFSYLFLLNASLYFVFETYFFNA